MPPKGSGTKTKPSSAKKPAAKPAKKPAAKPAAKISSVKLQQKAAGYHLAAANALEREFAALKH